MKLGVSVVACDIQDVSISCGLAGGREMAAGGYQRMNSYCALPRTTGYIFMMMKKPRLVSQCITLLSTVQNLSSLNVPAPSIDFSHA